MAPISVKLDQKNYNPNGFAGAYREAGNKFDGKVDQHAPYIMMDNRWNKFRLVWGSKRNTICIMILKIQLIKQDGLMKVRLMIKWQFLPSVNFTYTPWNNFNFRLAYSKV